MIVLMWSGSPSCRRSERLGDELDARLHPLRESWNIFQQVKPYSYFGLTVDHFTAGKSFAMKAAACPSL